MKKIKLCTAVAVISVFSIGMISANAAKNVFYDNFNSYNIGGLGSGSGGVWTSAGGTVAEGDATHGKIAKLEDTSTVSKTAIKTPSYTKAANETIVYMWDYMTDNITSDQRMIIYGETTSGDENSKALQIRTDAAGKLQYQSGSSNGWKDLCSITAGTWYHLKAVVSYTGTTGSIDLYLDGTQYVTGNTVMQSASVSAAYHKLLFGTYNSNADTGTMYIDNVSISSLGTYSELFADNFNSYTAGNGVHGSNADWAAASATISASGNSGNCACVADTSTANKGYIAPPAKTISDSVTYEWDYKTDTATEDQRIYVYGTASEKKKIIQIKTTQINGTWKLQYQNSSSWADICDLKVGSWHHFKLIVDVTNTKTALYVDGYQIFTGGGFMAATSSNAATQQIFFGADDVNGYTGTFYIDNVKIYNGDTYSETPDLSNITYYCTVNDSTSAITSLSAGLIQVRTRLVNLSSSAKDVFVIAALYDGEGRLVSADRHTSSGHSNRSTCIDSDEVYDVYCSVDATNYESGWKLKTFLWDGEENVTPLCDSVLLN